MKISKEELVGVLLQFNPWWRHERITSLPAWRRSVFQALHTWVAKPLAPRAVLLTGARQVGKTTLMLQLIDQLLREEVPAANILYAAFDHPMLKLAGADAVLKAWRECIPKAEGAEYLFLDEAQFISEWGVWIKHQVDFQKNRRITFTGSAMPLMKSHQESGVGRWHTIRLATLSFGEYLKLKGTSLPSLPVIQPLQDLFKWPQSDFRRAAETAEPYLGHFHEYLLHGGFPQTARMNDVVQAQRLLREDVVDKVLRCDITALFGVRRVLDLERTFLYLCMHDGGLLNMADLCTGLEAKRPTAQNFIELLEAVHLVYRLPPFGYGKSVLRARFKIYLADTSIAPAVMLKGRAMLEDPIALGAAAEASVFKHLLADDSMQGARFTYWHGKKDHEVDLVAEVGEKIVPFEVKYRSADTSRRALKGLLELCRQKSIGHAYIVTKSLDDFGLTPSDGNTQILRIPASLLCYWMS